MTDVWGSDGTCPVCGDPYDSKIIEAGLATFDHELPDGGMRTCEKPVPRMRCPDCGGFLVVVSQESPVEEYCVECDYHRVDDGPSTSQKLH